MSLASMYPALGRRNNLLRSMRGQSSALEYSSSVYDPQVDRSTLYMLPMRSRFWPGTDSLSGDEWQYWYGDIAVPEELSRPRRRPSCLQDEEQLNRTLLRSMRGSAEEESRARRASASAMESAASAAEQSMGHASRARSLRASSVSRLQATRDSLERDTRTLRASSASRRAVTPSYDDLYGDIEIPEELQRPRRRLHQLESQLGEELQSGASSRAAKYLRSLKSTSVRQEQTTSSETRQETRRSARARSAAAGAESEYLGLDTSRVYVPRWLENHPIPDPPASPRPPPSEIWPQKRPFYDLKSDYDAMLSYMGVTKDLKRAVVAA